MKIPDAAAVYLPSPSVARLKMLVHMTEVHSPHRTRSMALMGTVAILNPVPVNTGIATVLVLSSIMAARMSTMPTAVTTMVIVLLDTLLAIALPMMRPTSMSRPKRPAAIPPIAAALASSPAPFSVVSLR